MDKKIEILKKIAKEFNKNEITWAVGGSLLLYFKGIVNEFNDIDIMISEEDIEKTENILLSFGNLQQNTLNSKYKSKKFMEFTIEKVDFDIIGGFIIVKNNLEYYFPLKKQNIIDYIKLEDVLIPLQLIDEWLIYYKLMDRLEKVEIINNYLISTKGGSK